MPEFYELAANHIRGGYEEPYEVIGIRKDGTTFPIEVQAKTVPYADSQVRVVAVRDLTFRKQLERQAFELDLEQERVKLLKTFFQNASHEFRTPLSVIKTSAYMIKRSDENGIHEKRIEKINAEVERIDELVNDLLLMVKLDTDVVLKLESVNINTLLKFNIRLA